MLILNNEDNKNSKMLDTKYRKQGNLKITHKQYNKHDMKN